MSLAIGSAFRGLIVGPLALKVSGDALELGGGTTGLDGFVGISGDDEADEDGARVLGLVFVKVAVIVRLVGVRVMMINCWGGRDQNVAGVEESMEDDRSPIRILDHDALGSAEVSALSRGAGGDGAGGQGRKGADSGSGRGRRDERGERQVGEVDGEGGVLGREIGHILSK